MAVIITRAGVHPPLAFEIWRKASATEDFRASNGLERRWRDGLRA
jgi:hypothetical protein